MPGRQRRKQRLMGKQEEGWGWRTVPRFFLERWSGEDDLDNYGK